MIIIGILIALGLEQAVQVWHHHELDAQARENILQEIGDNKREIDAERVLISKTRQNCSTPWRPCTSSWSTRSWRTWR